MPSALSEDTAPSASLRDCLKAQAAPTHLSSQPEHLGGLSLRSSPQAGRKVSTFNQQEGDNIRGAHIGCGKPNCGRYDDCLPGWAHNPG